MVKNYAATHSTAENGVTNYGPTTHGTAELAEMQLRVMQLASG